MARLASGEARSVDARTDSDQKPSASALGARAEKQPGHQQADNDCSTDSHKSSCWSHDSACLFPTHQQLIGSQANQTLIWIYRGAAGGNSGWSEGRMRAPKDESSRLQVGRSDGDRLAFPARGLAAGAEQALIRRMRILSGPPADAVLFRLCKTLPSDV